MVVRRIVYAFTLVAAFVFYIMYPPWISWYFLILVLLFIPLDLIISLPGMLTKTIVLSAPLVVEKGANAVVKITPINLKDFPVRGIKVNLRVIGDEFNANCRILTSSKSETSSEVTIDTSLTGVTVFQIKKAGAVSLFGLFSLPLTAKGRVGVLVLPPTVHPTNNMALPRGLSLQAKPGGGFSEEHDIRSYRQGDAVRNVHWKLSAKLNSLLIREPLVPPSHSRLIQVEKWNDRAQRDLILGRLRWVSDYLLEQGMAFYIKFSESKNAAEISQISELYDFLCNALDCTQEKKADYTTLPTRFSWIYRIDANEKEAAT